MKNSQFLFLDNFYHEISKNFIGQFSGRVDVRF